MKKLLTIVVAAALVCAVAGHASAAALETSGELRVRGWYLDNYLHATKSNEFWDQRLRLKMGWQVAEGVKVNARADILEGFWGYNPTGDVGVPYDKRTEIAFDWANMEFAWPGAPVTFTVGRQDVTWGLGMAAAADNRDRLKIAVKIDPVTFGGLYDKHTEVFMGETAGQDDDRGWGGFAIATFAGWKMGLLEYYRLSEVDPLVDKSSLLSDFYFTGKAGPVELKGEFAYVFGKDDRDVLDVDTSGFGAYLGAFIPAGPVTIGAEGTYVSGDDPDTKDKNEGAVAADYQGPYWSVIFYNNMDYPGYAMDKQTSDYGKDTGVANAWSGKVTAIFSPVKNFTLIAAGLYAAANEVAIGDKDMGWEMDVIASYGVTENVNITAGLGYALLGNYWKGRNGAAIHDKPDNPLGTVLAFSVKF